MWCVSVDCGANTGLAAHTLGLLDSHACHCWKLQGNCSGGSSSLPQCQDSIPHAGLYLTLSTMWEMTKCIWRVSTMHLWHEQTLIYSKEKQKTKLSETVTVYRSRSDLIRFYLVLTVSGFTNRILPLRASLLSSNQLTHNSSFVAKVNNTYFYQNLASHFLHFNNCIGRPGSLTVISLVSHFQSTGSLDPVGQEHLPSAAFPVPIHQNQVTAAAYLKSISGLLARLPVSMREPTRQPPFKRMSSADVLPT